jgi:hypothetical protein
VLSTPSPFQEYVLLLSNVIHPTSLTTSLLPENFWSLITNHWSMIKRQMEAFHQAVHAAMEADCCCEDPEELCHIWDWICVVEYIVPCGKNIEMSCPTASPLKLLTCSASTCSSQNF